MLHYEMSVFLTQTCLSNENRANCYNVPFKQYFALQIYQSYIIWIDLLKTDLIESGFNYVKMRSITNSQKCSRWANAT